MAKKNTVRISRFFYLKVIGDSAYVQEKATGLSSPVFRKGTDIFKVLRYYSTPSAEFNAMCSVMTSLGTTDLNIIMREKKQFQSLYNKEQNV